MIQKVFMLFDNVCQLFVGSVVLLVNDAVAVRSFKDLVVDDKFQFSKNADDIDLYCLGSFNIQTGELVFDKHKVANLGELKNLKSKSAADDLVKES